MEVAIETALAAGRRLASRVRNDLGSHVRGRAPPGARGEKLASLLARDGTGGLRTPLGMLGIGALKQVGDASLDGSIPRQQHVEVNQRGSVALGRKHVLVWQVLVRLVWLAHAEQHIVRRDARVGPFAGAAVGAG